MFFWLNLQSKSISSVLPPTFRIGAALIFMLVLGIGLVGRAFAQSHAEFLDGDGMPYAAFDRLPHTDIDIDGSTLHVGFAPGDLALSKAQVLAWIEHSAHLVARYYGKYPVASARILVVPVDGAGVRGGTTWAYRGAAIRLLLGAQASTQDLKQDWMIVHEMVHLALPQLDREHDWLSEGLATYIEPVARVQAGDLDASSIWAAMVRDMPKGLPKSADQGLDRTPTWGRKYWGGAMFCMLADIEIRKKNGNRRGLRDAMRGVLAAGGNHEVRWSIQQVLDAADKATGTTVMSTLYARMATAPEATDLDALWNDLGIVRAKDGNVTFDNRKPLAKVRAAITD